MRKKSKGYVGRTPCGPPPDERAGQHLPVRALTASRSVAPRKTLP
ncbi:MULTISPECIES: hypothetical protein [Rudanella]|nr:MULTISPECIES: hypothetical protein [Rudanella]